MDTLARSTNCKEDKFIDHTTAVDESVSRLLRKSFRLPVEESPNSLHCTISRMFFITSSALNDDTYAEVGYLCMHRQ